MKEEKRQDTIVAPATAPGAGGIGIIRLSGPRSKEILRHFFAPTGQVTNLKSHRLYHGWIHSSSGEKIDEVMAVFMRAPHTYTREDVVEVHCHGGPQVMRRLLDLFIGAEARLARPGEFTLRAFLNGRLDLARAEAVADLIGSGSDAARQVALQQLEGKLSTAVYRLRARIVDLLAEIETHIDFPEEDIETADLDLITSSINDLLTEIQHLIKNFDAGRTLREGVSVLIVGKPNVGKSSLMNALLGEARAIVTPIAGTTRDTIEENVNLWGIPLRLIDSAGIRATTDPIEIEGVRRARDKITSADLVLLVIDGSRSVDADDLLSLQACQEKRVILVVNKSDLPLLTVPEPFYCLPKVIVSALTSKGMEDLHQAIDHALLGDGGRDTLESIMVSDRRHFQALVRTAENLEALRQQLANMASPEFLALELRTALQSLGEITGETTPEEILDKIFSRFCIGK